MLKYIGALLFAATLSGSDAYAQEQTEDSSATVDGIFSGIDVGGTPRRKSSNASGNSSSDSFAMRPGRRSRYNFNVNPTPTPDNTQDRENRAQARQQMIPNMNAPVAPAAPASPPVQAAPIPQTQAQPESGITPGNAAATSEYYRTVIEQVRNPRSGSAAVGIGTSNAKHNIAEKDRF